MIDGERGGASKYWVTRGLVIIALPTFLYVLAFVYEVGFARVFRIPVKFITVGVTDVFVVGGILCAVLLALFWLVEPFFLLLPRDRSPVFQGVLRCFPGVVLLAALVVLYGRRWHEWVWAAAALTFILFLQFGVPLMTQRGKTSYRDKLKAEDTAEAESTGGLMCYIEYSARLIIIWLVIALVVSYNAGQVTALRIRTFLVPSTIPDTVVLRIYGDKLVCAPLDRESSRLKGGFTVLKLGENSKVVLRPENLGPVHPVAE